MKSCAETTTWHTFATRLEITRVAKHMIAKAAVAPQWIMRQNNGLEPVRDSFADRSAMGGTAEAPH